MKLQSYGSDPDVLIYGAYLIEKDGRPLIRAPELLVRAGNKQRTLELHQPNTENTWRVQLPQEAANACQDLRFVFEELEVL